MKISDQNGVYELAAACAVTATNDKARNAVLHMAGGQVITTTLSFDEVAAKFNPSAAVQPAPPAAPDHAPVA